MDLRSMLNNESSARPPPSHRQQQQQHPHLQGHPLPGPPPPPPSHIPPQHQHQQAHPQGHQQQHRPQQPSPIQTLQGPQYQPQGYPPRQQQAYPPSPHHASPNPGNQYVYPPPSPHGGPPMVGQQHHYSYPHGQQSPAPYPGTPTGPPPPGHPQHPGYQQQQQQQQQQNQQQQHHHHHIHHGGSNSNAASPLQPQFYPPQSPHGQQFNQHYPRHPPESQRGGPGNGPGGPGPQRLPLLQTAPNDRMPPSVPSTPTSAVQRHPRGGDPVRDGSISPKTRVYPDEYERDADTLMRDDNPSTGGGERGYTGGAVPHSGGTQPQLASNIPGNRPGSHHRAHSQGTSSARRGSAMVSSQQQNSSSNQLQRNMDIDMEPVPVDGRVWNNAPGTGPADGPRKGVNGFDHMHPREVGQGQGHQTQNVVAPMQNSNNNNAPSVTALSLATLPQSQTQPQARIQQSPQQHHHSHPQQQQQQPPQQHHHHHHHHHQVNSSSNSNSQQQRPLPTNSSSIKTEPSSPFHHHRSSSNPSQSLSRVPQGSQPTSPKFQRDPPPPPPREIHPPPAPASMGGPPPRKRPRHEEPPIYARKASRSTSGSPIVPPRRNPPDLPSQSSQQTPPGQPLSRQNTGPPPQQQQAVMTPTNTTPSGPSPSVPVIIHQHHRPSHPNEHPFLGLWEPSLMNAPQYEELTRRVTDFLFLHVVKNDDPSLDWSGSGGGPVLEIEAKLGQVVDKQTGQRIRLPITTEAVLEESLFGFRSSMTEQQHKMYNKFLNDRFTECLPLKNRPPPPQAVKRSPSPTSLVASPSSTNSTSPMVNNHTPAPNLSNQNSPPQQPPTVPRVPMEYLHTKERDSFHELPPHVLHSLPPIAQRIISSKRYKPRIRLTTDMKTGKVLKRIVKCRVADMDIISPSTAFDWRVSVSLEVPIDGDVPGTTGSEDGKDAKDSNGTAKDGKDTKDGGKDTAVVVQDRGIGGGKGDGKGGGGERNKDRMSYRCLGGKFTVDLTQVTAFDAVTKEHELEVELDSAVLKKQGIAAIRGEKNGFEDLVMGFVDNVRVLVRAFQP